MRNTMTLKDLLRTALLVTTLLLVACSPESSSRKRMMTDGDYLVEESESLRLQNQDLVSQLQLLIRQTRPFVNSELEKHKEQRDPNMLMTKVIIPLKQVLFDMDNMLDPDFRNVMDENRRKLSYQLVSLFDQALIMVYGSNKQILTTTNILQTYKNIILWDCDENLVGSCKLINFFGNADSPNISKVMQIIYDSESDDAEKTRILRATFDLKNRRLDTTLRLMLMSRILESFELRQKGELSTTRRQLDNQLFATILKLDSLDFASNDSYIAIVEQLNPWTMSRSSSDEISQSMPELLKIASEKFLYSDSQKTSLSNSMQEAIEDLKYRVGSDFEYGIEFQKSNINGAWSETGDSTVFSPERDELVESELAANPQVMKFGSESKNILGSMLGDVNFQYDEYFYLTHQIFYEHYYISDSDSFWENSNRNSERLIEAATHLIKMQLVYNIVFTNARMNKFYENNDSGGLITLLQQTKQEADFLTLSWEKINLRATYLLDFINRVVPDSDIQNRRARDEFRTLVRAIKLNIKYLAAYPSMYPMLVAMTKNELKKSFWFGTIDHNTLINLFFSGSFSPWFSYGGNTVALDETELMVAFYYTIVTQTLSSYKNNSKMQFDAKEFFRIIVAKFIEENEKNLEIKLTNLKRVRGSYQSKIENLKSMCAEEIRLQERERQNLIENVESGNFDIVTGFNQTLLPRRQGKNDIDFITLGQSVVYPQNSDHVSDSAYKYFEDVYSHDVNTTFERLQSGYVLNNTKVKMLVEMYKRYAQDNDIAVEGEESLEQIIDEQFKKFNDLKYEYTELFFEMHEELKVNGQPCELPFLKRERDVRYALFFKEAQFLEDLFEKMYASVGQLTDEERQNLSEEKLASIESIRKEVFEYASQNTHLPDDFRENHGYSQMTAMELVQYKSDYYARVVDYLSEQPFAGQYQFSYPRRFDNIEDGLFQKSDKWRVRFDWTGKDKETAKSDFIKQGLLEFAKVFRWSSSSPDMRLIERKGSTITGIFKLNDLPIADDVNCSDPDQAQNCRSIHPAEVINHYKDMIDYMHYDPVDKFVFTTLGKVKKYTRTDYENIIKRQNNHQLFSYFDLIFKKVFSDSSVRSEEGVWFQDRLSRFTSTEDDLEKAYFIFPYNKEEIYGLFDNDHKLWIGDYFKSVKRFLVEAKNMAPTIEAGTYCYENDRCFPIGDSDPNDNAIDPVISEFQFGKFETFVGDMNRNFKFYYRSDINAHLNEIKEVVND